MRGPRTRGCALQLHMMCPQAATHKADVFAQKAALCRTLAENNMIEGEGRDLIGRDVATCVMVKGWNCGCWKRGWAGWLAAAGVWGGTLGQV